MQSPVVVVVVVVPLSVDDKTPAQSDQAATCCRGCASRENNCWTDWKGSFYLSQTAINLIGVKSEGFDWRLTVAVSKGRKLNSRWFEELRWLSLAPSDNNHVAVLHAFDMSLASKRCQALRPLISLRGDPLLIDYLTSCGSKQLLLRLCPPSSR